MTVVGVSLDAEEGVFGRLAIHHSLELIENICHGEIRQTEKWRGVILPLHALLLTPYFSLFADLWNRCWLRPEFFGRWFGFRLNVRGFG